jgi:hypothetical protein
LFVMAAKQSKSRKIVSKSVQAGPVQAAIDYGIDIPALIDNAGRSCTERIKRHQIALNTAEKLRKARKL